MQRVSVIGNSGSGKTRLARTLALALDARYLELDALMHQPGWTELPVPEFRTRVAEVVAGDRWVVDGNYGSRVQDLVWGRADTVVWLDYQRSLVMRRLLRRTVGRVITRRELWNGNKESWRWMLSRDPERSILRWAWVNAEVYRSKYEAAMADPAYAGLRFLRLRRPRDATALLARIDAVSRTARRG